MAETKRRRSPARTAKARENQLIALAADLAEQKLRDGTASSQLITTLLNLATTKAKLEMSKIKNDIKYTNTKIKNLEGAEELKELYGEALDAFKSYQGSPQDEEDDYEEYDED